MKDSRNLHQQIGSIIGKCAKAKLLVVASTLLYFNNCRPASSSDAFRIICHIGRSANLSESSGKNEITVAIMKEKGYSRRLSEKITQKIIDDNCPGVW